MINLTIRKPQLYQSHHNATTFLVLFTFFGTLMFYPPGVSSHGRLIEPPSRSSMWRYGFNTTANYNDHELYCGGFSRQHTINRGKCGVCGDPYDGAKPNEAGGPYAQGIIVRKYRQNSIIRIKVELTANHKGYFEFRICPNNNPKKVVNQKCLDNYLLQQSNSEGPRYYPGEGTKVFESRYLLPKGMTCTQCVLQWRYIAANSWGGPCADGSPEGLGCGPQEEFRACSDVAVYDDKGFASAEQPEYNDVEIDKSETGKNNTTLVQDGENNDTHATQAWAFIMAFIAFIFVVIGFGSILWWFYRTEIIRFLRETRNKLHFKRDSDNTSYDPRTYSTTTTTSVCRPVAPPRIKKLQNIANNNSNHRHHNHHHHNHPDIFGQRKQITPDVISQPLQVTINGLPV